MKKYVLLMLMAVFSIGCCGPTQCDPIVGVKTPVHKQETQMIDEVEDLVVYGYPFRGNGQVMAEGYDVEGESIYVRNLEADGSFFMKVIDDLIILPTTNGIVVEHLDGGKETKYLEDLSSDVIDVVEGSNDELLVVTVDPTSIVKLDGTNLYQTNNQIKDVLVEDDVVYVLEWIDGLQCVVTKIDLVSNESSSVAYDVALTSLLEVNDEILASYNHGYMNLNTNETFNSSWDGYGYTFVQEDNKVLVSKENEVYLDVFKEDGTLVSNGVELPNNIKSIDQTGVVHDDLEGLIMHGDKKTFVGYFNFEQEVFEVLNVEVKEDVNKRCIGVLKSKERK